MIGWNNVQRDDAHGHAGRVRVRHVRHLVARLPDVHGRDAQRHQPPVRDVRQRRQRRHARSARSSANETSRTLVPAEPAAAARAVVAPQQQQLRETGLLVSLNYIANNRVYFLRNFYEKSKRSILKAKTEGPAAYVLPANDPRLGAQAELLRVLQKQARRDLARDGGVHRARCPARPPAAAGAAAAAARRRRRTRRRRAAARRAAATRREAAAGARRRRRRRRRASSRRAATSSAWISRTRASPTRCSTISTGRRTIRRRNPYDDTGWTFPEGFGVQAVRVTDAKVLDAPMELVKGDVKAPSGVHGHRQRCSRSTTTPTTRSSRCATS